MTFIIILGGFDFQAVLVHPLAPGNEMPEEEQRGV